MLPKKLRFYAEGSGLVPNYEAQDAGVRRFVGRRFGPVAIAGEETARHGWVPTHEPEEVAYRAEYVREALHGHLVPADPETAAACGMAFQPYKTPTEAAATTQPNAPVES